MRIQKGKLRYSRRELWNLCDPMGHNIADGLQQFKDMLVKYNEGRGFIGVPKADMEVHEWFSILDEMIYAFRNKTPEYEGITYYLSRYKTLEGKKDWLIHDKLREEHENKVRRGRELFALYYDSLWD